MTTSLKGYGVNKSIPLTLLQLKVPLFLLENVLISQHKNVTASILPFSPFTSEMTNPAYVEELSLFGCWAPVFEMHTNVLSFILKASDHEIPD